MAENKRSFLFYVDWKSTFDELSDEDAGKLIKHICSYVNDENPTTDDKLLRAVFANIKSTLKRDLDKWRAKSLKNSENAKKRWDAKKSERMRTHKNAMRTDANYADNDIDNDIDIDKEVIDFNILLEMINKVGNREFKTIKESVKKKYRSLLKTGYTKDQIRNAIINAHKDDYHIETKFKYLTPEYFSRAKTIDLHGIEEVKKAPKPVTKGLYD